MMDEQNGIINEAFRSQSQMLNGAIKEFSQNNPTMISNAIRQQAEFFSQIIQQQSRIFADAMKQFDEKTPRHYKVGLIYRIIGIMRIGRKGENSNKQNTA